MTTAKEEIEKLWLATVPMMRQRYERRHGTGSLPVAVNVWFKQTIEAITKFILFDQTLPLITAYPSLAGTNLFAVIQVNISEWNDDMKYRDPPGPMLPQLGMAVPARVAAPPSSTPALQPFRCLKCHHLRPAELQSVAGRAFTFCLYCEQDKTDNDLTTELKWCDTGAHALPRIKFIQASGEEMGRCPPCYMASKRSSSAPLTSTHNSAALPAERVKLHPFLHAVPYDPLKRTGKQWTEAKRTGTEHQFLQALRRKDGAMKRSSLAQTSPLIYERNASTGFVLRRRILGAPTQPAR